MFTVKLIKKVCTNTYVLLNIYSKLFERHIIIVVMLINNCVEKFNDFNFQISQPSQRIKKHNMCNFKMVNLKKDVLTRCPEDPGAPGGPGGP